MTYFRIHFLGGLVFLFTVTVAVADTKIICQSELLKRNTEDSWANAIFYNTDSFSIDMSSKTGAVLLEPSLGKIKCSLTDTQISCRKEEKGASMIWSVNRLTGVYESFLQTSTPGDKGSKTRGICSSLGQRKF
jgi:hypothetical protein